MSTSGDAGQGPRTHGAAPPNGKENGRKRVSADESGPAAALGELGSYLAELKDQAALLVAAKVDGIKASLRRVALYVAAGLLGLVLLAVTVAAGAIYLFHGIAGGLSSLFGGIPWLGDLVAGAVLLGAVALALLLGLKIWDRAAARATMRKYEERRSARTSPPRSPPT